MNKIIQSYVWHEDKCFFVSTINRNTSAREAPDFIYAETLVWTYDNETRKAGSLLYQLDSIKNDIRTHLQACQDLHEYGKIEDCIENHQQD